MGLETFMVLTKWDNRSKQFLFILMNTIVLIYMCLHLSPKGQNSSLKKKARYISIINIDHTHKKVPLGGKKWVIEMFKQYDTNYFKFKKYYIWKMHTYIHNK